MAGNGDRGDTIRVEVEASDGTASSATASASATVANSAPTPSIDSVSSARIEGTAITVLGSASDPAGGNDAVSLAWAVYRGAVATGTPLRTGAGDTFQFTPDDDGFFTVRLTASDEDGGWASVDRTIAVDNVAPTVSLSGNANVDEGSVFELTLGAVIDPGADSVSEYRIRWGDGTAETYSAAQVAARGRKLTHVYDDGFFETIAKPIVVDLVDEDGTYVAAGTASVRVDNVAPSIAWPVPVNVLAGQSIVASASFSDPAGSADNAYTYRWRVLRGPVEVYDSGAWATAYAAGVPTLAYAPAAAGRYTVELTVVDKDGASDLRTQSVDVSPTVVELVRLDPGLTNLGTVRYRVRFSDPVAGLTAAHFALATTGVSGAALSSPTNDGDGTSWTIAVSTGTGDGTVQVSLAGTGGLTGPDGVSVASQTLAGPLYTIDRTAAQVLEFRVTYGNGRSYDLATATRLNLPWAIKGLSITFSEAVTVDASNLPLLLTGRAGNLGVGTLSGNGTNTLTWTFPTPILLDQVTATLSTTGGIRDAAGNNLMAVKSTFGFAVVLGDVNGDKKVTSTDVAAMRSMILTRGTSIFYDLNGDGIVDNADLTILNSRLGTGLF